MKVRFLGSGDVLFLFGCIVGGLVAAAFGYVVGLPSLRLRGDYLAIVTLGFGEILRVILQRSDDVLYLLDDVKKTLCFLVDMADFATFNEAYIAGFGDSRPARSTIGVAGLPIGAQVEIEAWAYKPA